MRTNNPNPLKTMKTSARLLIVVSLLASLQLMTASEITRTPIQPSCHFRAVLNPKLELRLGRGWKGECRHSQPSHGEHLCAAGRLCAEREVQRFGQSGCGQVAAVSRGCPTTPDRCSARVLTEHAQSRSASTVCVVDPADGQPSNVRCASCEGMPASLTSEMSSADPPLVARHPRAIEGISGGLDLAG